MAVALSPAQRALIRGRNLGVRILAEFRFSGTTYRFTDHTDSIVWGGHTWLGTGQLADLSSRALSMGTAAEGVSLRINGAGLATDGDPSGATLLSAIYAEAKKSDPVDLFLLYFDGATGVPVFDTPFMLGRLAGAPLSRTPGGAAVMTLEIEPEELMLSRAPGRTRTDTDQRRMWPTGGGGLHLVATAAAQAGSVWWGQDAPSGGGTAASPGGFGGGGGARSQETSGFAQLS